jgi:hypothetical protein
VTPGGSSSSDDDDSLSSGLVALIVILVALVVGATAVAVCLKMRQQRGVGELRENFMGSASSPMHDDRENGNL